MNKFSAFQSKRSSLHNPLIFTGAMIFLMFLSAMPSKAGTRHKAYTTILVIDTSSSMKAHRKDKAAMVAASLYIELAAAEGPIGVVAFDSKAKVIVDPKVLHNSAEVAAVLGKIQHLRFEGKWTEYRIGLEKAAEMLGDSSKDGHIVFLTDGDMDPNPEDTFNQTESYKEELKKHPGCVRIDKKTGEMHLRHYGTIPPHRHCEPIYRQLYHQSIDKIEEVILPQLRKKKTKLDAVALQIKNPESLGLLKSWSVQTGGTFFPVNKPAELPRAFSEVFAQATASTIEEATKVFTIEHNILSLQVVAAAQERITLQLTRPGNMSMICNRDSSLADCYVSAGIEPREQVVRVSRPADGKWRLNIQGKGKRKAEVILVKRYDIKLRLLVDGLPADEIPYFDSKDTRVIRLEALSGAGEPLPADATFLKNFSARVSMLSMNGLVNRVFPAVPKGPGVFKATIEAPAASIPGKKSSNDKASHREFYPLKSDLLMSGAVVATASSRLVPANAVLTASEDPLKYPEVKKPFNVVVFAALASGTNKKIEPKRLEGCVVQVFDDDELTSELKFEPDKGYFSGSLVREKRVNEQEQFGLRLVRNGVILGAGNMRVMRPWTWLDYLREYGPYLGGAMLILLFLIGRYMPARFPKRLKLKFVCTDEDGETEDPRFETLRPKNPLFRASKVIKNTAVRGKIRLLRLKADKSGIIMLEDLKPAAGVEFDTETAPEKLPQKWRDGIVLIDDKDRYRLELTHK